MNICALTFLKDWLLTAELLKHLGGARETIAALTDGNIEDELLNLELTHGVAGLPPTGFEQYTRQEA